MRASIAVQTANHIYVWLGRACLADVADSTVTHMHPPHAPQTADRIYVWLGRACPTSMADSARFHAKLLLKFEDTGLMAERMARANTPPVVEVKQVLSS